MCKTSDITEKSTKTNELMLLEKLSGVVNYNLRKRIINMWKNAVFYISQHLFSISFG